MLVRNKNCKVGVIYDDAFIKLNNSWYSYEFSITKILRCGPNEFWTDL